MMTPLDWASFAIASPVGPSSGSTMRTLAPRLMSAVASFSWVWSLPCALSIRYCCWVYPASAKAAFRYGWSKLTYCVDDVVSGRITPTCRLVAPLVAKWVSGLNAAIVGPTFTVKELMLTFGIVLEPLAVGVDEDDDPQPAAIRLATAARPTQPARRECRNVPPPCERERRPPSLLLPSPIPTPLSPENTRISGHCTTCSTCVSWISRTEVLPSAARPALRALALIIHAGQAAHSSPGRASPMPVPAIAAVAGVAPEIRPRGINTALTSWPPHKNTVNGGPEQDAGGGSLRREAVASPRLGEDERGASVGFQLGPQPPDVHPHVLGLGLVPVPPHAPQQVRMGQQLAAVGGKLAQQGELRGGQVHGLAVPGHLLAGQVDLDVPRGDDRRSRLGRGGGPGAAQCGGDPGQQFLDAERLGHVVVGANVERGHLVPLPAAGRHHDDRHAGLLADLPAQLETVDLGQHQVEQDDVRLLGLQQLQRPGAVGGHYAVKAPHGQVRPDEVNNVRVVLHHERAGVLGVLSHDGPVPARLPRSRVPWPCLRR